MAAAAFLETTDFYQVEDGKLYQGEIFWRDIQPWLQEQGYTLRPRYHPDWVASWLQPAGAKSWHEAEDGFRLPQSRIIDAKCADGSLVAMKCIETERYPHEVAIAKLFSSESMRSNSSNYCVPVLNVLQIPDKPGILILVMPLLWDDDPLVPLETIGEAIERIRQIFEGLRFMHEQGVAHRDCKFDNIMTDITPLYHESPPHPWKRKSRCDFKGEPKIISCRTRRPLKYYFIDFGLSRLYQPKDAPHLEPPSWGGDRSVPEFQYDDPCDPFAVDVYCIGNYVRNDFLKGRDGVTRSKKGLEFLDSLLADMTQEDPKKRPTMDEVVARFTKITAKLTNKKLRSRLTSFEERPMTRFFRDAVHWVKQLAFAARRIPAIPSA